MFPNNEAETIQLFKLVSRRLGWRIVHLQTAFPDAVIENEQGRRLIVEFEFASKNFRAHKHDPDGCDLIICWNSLWENPPVPVWELQHIAQKERDIVASVLSKYVPKRDVMKIRFQVERFRRKVAERDNEIRELDKELSAANERDWDTLFIEISGNVACVLMALGIFFWGLYLLIDWLVKIF